MASNPPAREPEPAFGPDEEGEVPLDKTEVPDDGAAWVHEKEPEAR